MDAPRPGPILPLPEVRADLHLAESELESGWSRLPVPTGRVAALCSRLEEKRRWLPEVVAVEVESGIEGDRWWRDRERGFAKYRDEYREMQIAVMDVRIASLIANGQPLCLFGDNLFLDLDLSEANLPVGTSLAIGSARFEVTAKPHTGCSLFRARFGDAALRFTARPDRRSLHLRGIYLRTVVPGRIAVGDLARVEGR